VLTNIHTDKQTLLKASTSLRYASLVSNNVGPYSDANERKKHISVKYRKVPENY